MIKINKMSTGLFKGGVPVGDGSWTLTVFVTDLQVERNLRVRGDLHIGGVMIRLVDELGKLAKQDLQHCRLLSLRPRVQLHRYVITIKHDH